MRISEVRSAITRHNKVLVIAERMVKAAIPCLRDEKNLVVEDVQIFKDHDLKKEFVLIEYKHPEGINVWDSSTIRLPLELFGCSDRAVGKYMDDLRKEAML